MFAATHLPLSPGPPASRFADKIIHFVLYFMLVVLGARWFVPTGAMPPTLTTAPRRILAWAAVFTAYAAFDEWLQQFVGRTMSGGDLLADTAGIAAATIILIARRRSGPISAAGGETPGD